eukprot:superscaffoldBa00001443_g10580
MMLRGLGDDLDDNDRNDKGRFSGLIAFDFPVGQQVELGDRAGDEQKLHEEKACCSDGENGRLSDSRCGEQTEIDSTKKGQRTCRRHSTQPECDKATQSDRATRRFLTPSTFDTHFTHSRTSGTDESRWEMEASIYIYQHLKGPEQ